MGNLNKVFLIGRLGGEPEPKQTPSGKSVLNITLATSEYYKGKDGSKQDRTEWHRVVFWERTADIVAQYCRKGSQLFVEGSLQTREWQDKNGNKRYTTEIVGRNIQLLDPKSEGQRPGVGLVTSQGLSMPVSGTDKPSKFPGYQTTVAPQAEPKKFEVKGEVRSFPL